MTTGGIVPPWPLLTFGLALGITCYVAAWISVRPVLVGPVRSTFPIRTLLAVWLPALGIFAFLAIERVGLLEGLLRASIDDALLLFAWSTVPFVVKLTGALIANPRRQRQLLIVGRFLNFAATVVLALMTAITVPFSSLELRDLAIAAAALAVAVVLFESRIDAWVNPTTLRIKVVNERTLIIATASSVGAGLAVALLGYDDFTGVAFAIFLWPLYCALSAEAEVPALNP